MQTRPRVDSRLLWGALTAILLIAALSVSFLISYRGALNERERAQSVQIASRVQALESVLMRQRAVATVLSDDSTIREGLLNPDPDHRRAISQKLDRLRAETDSAVIYLLDRAGVAVAASNWNEARSFVGQDYSFRDYFTEALLRGEATQFALGTISHRAGLYLSHDVIAADRTPLGVIVVKVEFDHLEASWRQANALTYVADAAGQIILSSDPALRFGTPPLPRRATVSTQAMVPGADWRMVVTEPAAPAFYAAALTTGSVGFGLTLLGVAAGFRLRARRQAARRAEEERRYRADLELAVDERTRALSDEMRERRETEARLHQLQADMVQANKLAALGQITAGVAHEVNQPLATIRLLAETGSTLLPVGQSPEVAENLSTIMRMTERITRITQQLRGFARKATGHVGPVELAPALDAALMLTATRRETQGIALDLPVLPPGLCVMAETVRLEQVLVNLLQNAQEALSDTPAPRIWLTLEAGDLVRLTVSDNGPGLSPEVEAQLFMPFATTKPQGLGLGLVISQEIARDFGGSLRAAPQVAGQGATFILELPRAA
ncbi:sensor histidine kinase [Paracoccus laeviglucosivorans]|uniref:histidine kinase n=1 Tax=Paracoccus laeviglucosivorans TaxID=1197861 RepID=A0A521F687_9RHOB|nr:ATP-binding protein [Paracoccus laeviglucosivorans]SMO91689.1 two-component system, NtrC family, C4-dicarboxylate transport sensor histidine kinase DctB [Paracoccus laeviglucosivorans]